MRHAQEETFQLIDTKPVKKPTGLQRGRGQGRGWGAGGRGWGQPADPRAGVPPEPVRGGMAARGRGGRFGQQGRGWGYRPWDQPRVSGAGGYMVFGGWCTWGYGCGLWEPRCAPCLHLPTRALPA